MGSLISQLWDLSISQLWDLSSLNYGISHLSIMGSQFLGPLNYGISQLWDLSSLNMGSLNPNYGISQLWDLSQSGISQSGHPSGKCCSGFSENVSFVFSKRGYQFGKDQVAFKPKLSLRRELAFHKSRSAFAFFGVGASGRRPGQSADPQVRRAGRIEERS